MNAYLTYDRIEDRRWVEQQLTDEKEKWIGDRADAWQIITANKISIYAMSEADKRGGWGAEAFHPNDAYSFNDNPLLAAMIVFLMMQESANVPANSTGSDLR